MDQAGLDEFLCRARRRDPQALGELVEMYSPRVFGLLYRLTGRWDVAEDLMQETFLRVVRVIDKYDHVGKFESWLFRIAANLARDRARQLGRRGTAMPLDGADGDESCVPIPAVSADHEPDSRLLGDEAGRQLAQALEHLSDGDREVIVLRHYSGLAFREIAELLGIPLGTALARAHRALKRLRDELSSED